MRSMCFLPCGWTGWRRCTSAAARRCAWGVTRGGQRRVWETAAARGGVGAGGALPGHCCGASAACSRSPASPMGPSVMTRRGSEATQATYTLRSPVDPAGFSPISRAAEYDVRTLSETVTLPV